MTESRGLDGRVSTLYSQGVRVADGDEGTVEDAVARDFLRTHGFPKGATFEWLQQRLDLHERRLFVFEAMAVPVVHVESARRLVAQTQAWITAFVARRSGES